MAVGVACIALAVALSSRVLASADESVRIWSVTRDLPAGAELRASDVAITRVRLFGLAGARYVAADHGAGPAGRVLARAVGAGELLPVAALADTRAPRRLVTVPLERDHALGGTLARGDVVDIVATVREPGGRSVTAAVLTGVLVVDVVRDTSALGVTGDLAVVVSIAPEHALALTAAVRGADLDILKVVPGAIAGDIGSGSVTTGVRPRTSPPR